ncbi:MAG: squalene/phytoene synthase family protein [Rhodobacterales bacterium]|nr:squalene/phytoene synthase family protein [Rhodobacterales bacterium]
MSLEACAALVARGDPDRWAALLAAPVAARARLLPLFALNLELARAPWAAREPMIAEMRLQWWRDALEDAARGRVRAHEVMTPLAELMAEAGLPLAVLDRLAAARRWDVWTEPFDDAAALTAYLDETAGGLMWLSAQALGAPAAAEGTVRAYARAAGTAAFLRAVPELVARGRHPLPEGADPADLARAGLDALAQARAGRGVLPRAAAPALLPGWQAGPLLAQVLRDPGAVAQGRLGLSEFARRGRLMWQSATGRW